MPVTLSRRGDHVHHHLYHHCPTCAHAGINAANSLLIPQAMISSCLLAYLLTSFWARAEDYVYLYHFFIAKMSQWAISWESMADIQFRGFSVSLWSNMNILSVAVRLDFLTRAGLCFFGVCVCACVCVCVCVCECFNMFSVIGWMPSAWCCHTKTCVMTSSFLSLLGCHDVSDGIAGRTLRLCRLTFFVFFPTWPTCCRPSVYVNSCHTKKSHINSKRHNKLLLWEYWTFYCIFFLKWFYFTEIFCRQCRAFNYSNQSLPRLSSRGSSCTVTAGSAACSSVHCMEEKSRVCWSWRAMANKLQPPAGQGHQIKVFS